MPGVQLGQHEGRAGDGGASFVGEHSFQLFEAPGPLAAADLRNRDTRLDLLVLGIERCCRFSNCFSASSGLPSAIYALPSRVKVFESDGDLSTREVR
jgi:hypothetical protein